MPDHCEFCAEQLCAVIRVAVCEAVVVVCLEVLIVVCMVQASMVQKIPRDSMESQPACGAVQLKRARCGFRTGNSGSTKYCFWLHANTAVHAPACTALTLRVGGTGDQKPEGAADKAVHITATSTFGNIP